MPAENLKKAIVILVIRSLDLSNRLPKLKVLNDY